MKFFKPSLNYLLLFIPLAVWFNVYRPDSATAIFIFAGLAIVPLAGLLGTATEHLAARTSEGIGGFLNATFGNAAELIIAIMALKKGLNEVVKASITGSILGNVLLVLGLSLFCGGIKHKEQRFNKTGAQTQSTMLSLAAASLIMPAIFHYAGGFDLKAREHTLSAEISIVLLLTYFASLFFSLKTHRELFSGAASDAHGENHPSSWPIRRSVGLLLVATALIAWMSEILVGSVEAAAHALGMNSIFIGVIVVAIIGNAAEHSTAVMMALRNRMDLALGISLGSSIQISLFVAPLLVLLSYFIAPSPLNLIFSQVEVVSVLVASTVIFQVGADGRSNWFEGIQLLALYAILGLIFFHLPEQALHP